MFILLFCFSKLYWAFENIQALRWRAPNYVVQEINGIITTNFHKFRRIAKCERKII
jgi:hypothetical protein